MLRYRRLLQIVGWAIVVITFGGMLWLTVYESRSSESSMSSFQFFERVPVGLSSEQLVERVGEPFNVRDPVWGSNEPLRWYYSGPALGVIEVEIRDDRVAARRQIQTPIHFSREPRLPAGGSYRVRSY